MPKGATPVISVFILGGTGKQKNLASLRDILRKNCTLTLIGEQQIDIQKENPDFALVEIENLSRITAPNTIILCKEPFYAPVNATLPADAVGLLSSDNLPAAEFIRRCGVIFSYLVVLLLLLFHKRHVFLPALLDTSN